MAATNNTIYIFNPKETPYGALSNNSTSYFELDGEKWKTVTHYIFSSMLHFPTFKALVRNQPKVRNVYNIFINLYLKEIHDITISAIYEATKVKFQDPELMKLILSTTGYDIIYVSDNPVFGVKIEGDKFIGENHIGKALMKIRNSERNNDKKAGISRADKLEEQIYEIYKAYHVLESIVNQNNSDVNNLKDSSYEEIIRIKPNIKFADKKLVIELYNQGSFPIVKQEFENPGNLVPLFRKKFISQINKKNILVRQNMILKLYLNYFLEKRYEDVPKEKYDAARGEALAQLNTSQLANLRERVSYLFEKGMLSASLSDKIDLVLNNFPPPFSKKEIDQIKSYEIVKTEVLTPEKEEEKNNIQQRLIFIQENLELNPPEIRPLSPFFHFNMEIFALEFPTIIHYIFIKLMSVLRQFGTLNEAYTKILIPTADGVRFRNIASLQEVYIFEKEKEYVQGLEGFCVLGMDKKFVKNSSLQDLLISTEGKKLVYSDFNPILGQGTREEAGSNFVGKYLMEIRKQILEERSKSGQIKIQAEDISNLLLKDLNLREWMEGRMADFCQTIGIVREYISSRYEFSNEVEITPNFILLVLQNFYPSCYGTYESFDTTVTHAPREFIAILAGCPGFNLYKNLGKSAKMQFDESKNGIVQVFWKYFTSMFYGLLKIDSNLTSVKLKQMMANAEIKLSKERPCITRLRGKNENCILSAMLNILNSLKEITENYDEKFTIDDRDILAAAKILLNRHPVFPNKFPESTAEEIEKEVVLNAIQKIDPMTGVPMVKYLLDVVQYIAEFKDVSKNTKRNRVNFFTENIS